MTKNWFETHLESVQKRYAIGSGIFTVCFTLFFLQRIAQKESIFITIMAGYAFVHFIALGWRYLGRQSLIKEFNDRIPEDEQNTQRRAKVLRYITRHEEGLWVGWCSALGYTMIITTIPQLAFLMMIDTIRALWSYHKLQEVQEFVTRMEILGWEKLRSLTHDPLLKKIDLFPSHRTPAVFLYKNFKKSNAVL